jgi:hypothetical protein
VKLFDIALAFSGHNFLNFTQQANLAFNVVHWISFGDTPRKRTNQISPDSLGGSERTRGSWTGLFNCIDLFHRSQSTNPRSWRWQNFFSIVAFNWVTS